MKKLIFLFFLLVQVYNLNQIFYSSASAEDRSVTVKPKKGAETQAAADSKYFAIIIGNQNYKYLPKLETPVSDAKAVENILKSQYGFETKLLTDAPRKDILSTINDFRKKLSSKDNLLIYYAGHGEFDKTADRAYWLPVDAQRDDPVDWISATDITDNIKRIASKHILIVSDSCYSGTLTRAAAGDLSTKGGRDEFIKKMIERPSRTLMASGGNEPVADSGGGDHSVFASAFLKALKEADKGIFTAEELFHGRVKTIVAGKSEQVPEYNDIKNSGHEGGDFVFMAKAIVPGAGREAAPLTPIEIQEPAGSGFKIDDLEKEEKEIEKNKTAWNGKLSEMKEAYGKVKTFEQGASPADRKAAAWQRFLETFNQDNPYSQEDDTMRQETEERISHWNNQQIAMALPGKVWKAVTGKSYTDPITGMEFVFVKGGCFQMGDTFGDGGSDEKPVHEVCVDDIYMGKYEVTQGQWKAIMGNNPSRFEECGDNCPVEKVSWNDIQDFISKLNSKSGKSYRLPTEAEWEYAARSGGKNEKYAGGNDIDNIAWYSSNSGSKTHPVGQKQPNGLGLYDMSGNVWEWVQDWYDGNYYKNSPKDNPKGANSGADRVLRGGSWGSLPNSLRAANRAGDNPGVRGSSNGFRLVVSFIRQ